MKWIGAGTTVVLAALAVCGAQGAGAQQYGERAGNSYLPSTHDAGCGGVLCSSLPVDPTHPSEVLPPPPCQGLLCGVTPYGMETPHTAAEAAAVAQQRAAAQAAAAPPPAPVVPAKHVRKHRKKVRAAAAAAPRTPAPPAAPAQ